MVEREQDDAALLRLADELEPHRAQAVTAIVAWARRLGARVLVERPDEVVAVANALLAAGVDLGTRYAHERVTIPAKAPPASSGPAARPPAPWDADKTEPRGVSALRRDKRD